MSMKLTQSDLQNNGVSELIPIGTILPFGGTNYNSLPSNWLLCIGTEVLKSEYSELYTAIGDNYKGIKTLHEGKFYIPDFRECSVKGASSTNNEAYSMGNHHVLGLGAFQDDQLERHVHDLFIGDTRVNKSGVSSNQDIVSSIAHATSTDWGKLEASEITQGRIGSTTEVKSIGVYFIIKAK